MSVRGSLIAAISLAMVLVVPGSALAGSTDIADPFITITTPASGAHYLLDSVVYANYSCSDTGGSGLASCAGPVASGAPIDTSYLGYHIFNVVATDNASNSANAANGYFVVTDAQPDARIRRIGRTNQVGNDIYNGDASGQALQANADGATIRRFVISIQNDRATPDSFDVFATGLLAAGYDVSFHNGHPGTDITAAIINGTFTTPTIAPGAIFRIRVVVVVSPPLGASGITLLVKAASAGDSLKFDTVRFTVGEEFPCLAASC